MSEPNGTNSGNPVEKISIKEKAKRKGHEFAAKHPKATKVAKRIAEGVTLLGTGFAGYIIGKKSVKPTFIEVHPIEPETEPAQTEEETPTEEVEAEE